MNSAGLNLEAKKINKKNKKIKNLPPLLFGWHGVAIKPFDISHNLYLPPCYSELTSAFSAMNSPEVGLFPKSRNCVLKRFR